MKPPRMASPFMGRVGLQLHPDAELVSPCDGGNPGVLLPLSVADQLGRDLIRAAREAGYQRPQKGSRA